MKRLLYISHRVPYPPDKGERLRAYHQIRLLATQYDVTLATLSHSRHDAQDLGPLSTWCRQVIVERAAGRWGLACHPLRLAQGQSATQLYFGSRRLTQRVRELHARQPFDIVMGYCSSVLGPVLAVPAPVRIMDLVDVDSAKWFSYARAAGLPMRWAYRREAAAVATLERQALDHCQAVLLTSDAEVPLLPKGGGPVHVVGNGVDSDYFSPGHPVDNDHPSLVFTGTMDYRPNVEGVCWFARDVWPSLRRAMPTLQFRIVGRDPHPSVQALAQQPGIVVTGSVPDVRPFLRTASIAVVPLKIARGIQNKILEAMACGRPVVASPEALKGINARVGLEVLQAHTPAEWTAAIGTLLADVSHREALGQAGRDMVLQQYTWPAQLSSLLAICGDLVQERPQNAELASLPIAINNCVLHSRPAPGVTMEGRVQ